MLNYGLDVHKRYTTFCVMDDRGKILMQGRSPNDELPLHPAFSLKRRKRTVMEVYFFGAAGSGATTYLPEESSRTKRFVVTVTPTTE